MKRLPSTSRGGYTLIEILVVLSIILVVTALALAFIYRAGPRDREAIGASQVSGNLLIAKQRALRDRAPRGIRLIVVNNECKRLQFIEQPDDFSMGQLFADAQMAAASRVRVIPPQGIAMDLRESIAPNDFLEMLVDGTFHRIVAIGPNPMATPPLGMNELQLLPPAAGPPSPPSIGGTPFQAIDPPTTNWRVLRAPRPLQGEDEVKLPNGVMIDFRPLQGNTQPRSFVQPDPFNGNLDILFSPSGHLLRGGANGGKFVLWISDDDEADPSVPANRNAGGNPLLVTVYARTGLIATHPICREPLPPPNNNTIDWYRYTRDGKTSGY